VQITWWFNPTIAARGTALSVDCAMLLYCEEGGRESARGASQCADKRKRYRLPLIFFVGYASRLLS
jgi:hypothetical protein